MFCRYRCGNFAAGALPDRAALATDCVAKLAMTSRRRSFCFLNLLNLALSPFCDDICPRSSNLFVTQRAEDKSVRSSIRQATDGRCEAQGTLRRNPLRRLRVRLLGLLPGCRQNVLRHARSILHFSKDLPCRCGLGNLTQRSGRREVPEKRGLRKLRRTLDRRTPQLAEIRTFGEFGSTKLPYCRSLGSDRNFPQHDFPYRATVDPKSALFGASQAG